MLSKTRGIALHSTAYNDKYSIIHVYTEGFGRVSYVVPRTKGKKKAISNALFMPFSVLEMEVDHKNNRDIQRIKEVKSLFATTHLSSNPIKNVLALFLAEFVFRVVRETEPDEALFAFLMHTIQLLELTDKSVANFHIVFLLRLLHHQGIFPNIDTYREGSYFDMLNAVFVDHIPIHKHYITESESVIFAQLLRINFGNMHAYEFSRTERVRIIDLLINYYRLHLPSFPEIKSFSIMQTLFD